MKQYFIFLTTIFFALATLFSCTEDIKTDQYNDLDLTPTVEASLLYVEVPEELVNIVNDSTVFSNKFNFDAFNSGFFVERVIEGSITYVVENTTSKGLKITVEFLDESEGVLDTEVFNLQAAPTNIRQKKIVYGPTGENIDIITNLSSIRVSAIKTSDSNNTSTVSEPKITVKSKGEFTIRLK